MHVHVPVPGAVQKELTEEEQHRKNKELEDDDKAFALARAKSADPINFQSGVIKILSMSCKDMLYKQNLVEGEGDKPLDLYTSVILEGGGAAIEAHTGAMTDPLGAQTLDWSNPNISFKCDSDKIMTHNLIVEIRNKDPSAVDPFRVLGTATIPLKRLNLKIMEKAASDFSVQATLKVAKKKVGQLLLNGSIWPDIEGMQVVVEQKVEQK
jgi:hypothetical protein